MTPTPVVSVSPVVLSASQERGADLELRVSAPKAVSGLPVLVFAHGFRQSLDGYISLTHYWAARGFVVIQPTFLDPWRYSLPESDPRTQPPALSKSGSVILEQEEDRKGARDAQRAQGRERKSPIPCALCEILAPLRSSSSGAPSTRQLFENRER